MQVRLPNLSKDAESAVITLWHVKENDRIMKDQELVEISTDKATFDVPTPCDGILTEIMKKEGDEVQPDEVIAEIREDKDG